MTTECAREIINLVLNDNKNMNVRQALGKIDQLICRNERYKWHDLRKNPEDLPPKGKTVVVACESKGIYNGVKHQEHTTTYYDGNFFTNLIYESAIAWKEIEPFEVEDDD